MGRNWPCRSPGDKGTLGLQGQGSDFGLDMVSKGHSQAGPYRNLPGRLSRQRRESCVTHVSFNHPAQVPSHVHKDSSIPQSAFSVLRPSLHLLFPGSQIYSVGQGTELLSTYQ